MLLLIYFIIIIIIIIFNWYKLDWKFFAELRKFFPISNKLLIITISTGLQWERWGFCFCFMTIVWKIKTRLKMWLHYGCSTSTSRKQKHQNYFFPFRGRYGLTAWIVFLWTLVQRMVQNVVWIVQIQLPAEQRKSGLSSTGMLSILIDEFLIDKFQS